MTWLKVGSAGVDADAEMVEDIPPHVLDEEREANRKAACISVSNLIPIAVQCAR